MPLLTTAACRRCPSRLLEAGEFAYSCEFHCICAPCRLLWFTASFHAYSTYSTGSLSGRAAGLILAFKFDHIYILFSFSGYFNLIICMPQYVILLCTTLNITQNDLYSLFFFCISDKEKKNNSQFALWIHLRLKGEKHLLFLPIQCIEHFLLLTEIFQSLT